MGFFYAIKEFISLFVLFINDFNRTICMYKEYFYIDLTRCCVVSRKGRLRCIFVSANQYYWKYTTKWDMIFCFSKTQICIFIYWKQNIVNNQTSLFYKRQTPQRTGYPCLISTPYFHSTTLYVIYRK